MVSLQDIKSRIKRTSVQYGNPVKTCNIAGYKLVVDTREGIQKSMYINVFELDETKWIYDILKPGMIFIDVGASFGYYSFIASSLVGDTGRVYAFEPSERAYEMFTRNIQKNHIRNITTYNSGLGNKNQYLELYDSIGLKENVHNIHAPSFVPAGRHYVANQHLGMKPIITLDRFAEIHGIRYIDLIKIDVEGMEMQVLEGMKQLLQESRVNRVMIEFVDHAPLLSEGSVTQKMDKLLTSSGFKVEKKRVYEKGAEPATTSNFLYVNELAGAKYA